MKMGCRNRPSRLAMAALLLGGLLGCVDGEVVYVEQPPWTQAPAEAMGFAGYDDSGTKLTTCGNCHEGVQAEWQETPHSGAWETLQGSGHAADYCEACHTVSHLGNATSDPSVGFGTAREDRYVDVQCESCHGPGLLTHVANPAGDRPLASFEAAVDAENGCGECHEGSHHPFVEQWAESAHGAGPHTEYASGISDSCKQCHEGQQALEVTFGVTADYLEKGDGELRTITCVVCHDPHGSEHGGQLRASIEVPTTENLCMRCHTNNGTPWSSHGPHAAQGLLILGEDMGYLPPGFTPPDPRTTNFHGPPNNPRLCASCHVSRLTVTDAGGDFLLESVGHTFEAVSCLDSEGLPVFEGECSLEDRTFAACAQSGCHGSESMARDRYSKVWNRLNVLLDDLWADTDEDHVLEATDDGLLPQVIALGFGSDLDPDDPTVTPAKGAMWNAMLAWTDDRTHWSDGEVDGAHFSAHPNSGNGVHNPALLEALLLASIGHVRASYGVQPSPAFESMPQLAGASPDDPSQE